MIWYYSSIIILSLLAVPFAQEPPNGYENAAWGSSAAQVQTILKIQNWQPDQSTKNFPPDLNITVFKETTEINGRKATVQYYFWEDKFFQSTIRFEFNDLKNFDFNYNVYRSVNEYYTVIRSKSLVFVHDIYALLNKKYGMKEPVFKGLDPRSMFVKLDAYLKRERWNLRYHPYDYYQRIVTAAYARWDFPKTRVIFSVNISAIDKRFDFLLSHTSLDLERLINKKMDQLRYQRL